MATALGHIVTIYNEVNKANPDREAIARLCMEILQTWARTAAAVPDADDMTSIRAKLDVTRVYLKNTSGAALEIILDGAEYSIPNDTIWALSPGEWSMIEHQNPGKLVRDTRANFEGASGAVQVCDAG